MMSASECVRDLLERKSRHARREVKAGQSPSDAGEDPDRWLIIGPDTAANLIEVVVMITAEGNQIAIHAMPMRDKYARLLGP